MQAALQVPAARPSPTRELVDENRRRGRSEPEFELLDTGVFADDRYFDVVVEYAKADAGRHPDPHHGAPTAGPEPAPLHLLPTLWFRNTWSWGTTPAAARSRAASRCGDGCASIASRARRTTGDRWLLLRRRARRCSSPRTRRTRSGSSASPTAARYVKDGINDSVVHGRPDAVNPARVGHQGRRALPRRRSPPGGSATICGCG